MSVGAGALLAGRYRLEERIATGGMGEVWQAVDERLDRRLAVKVLKAEYVGDASFRARFRLEAQHMASLHHPGIAALFDYGEDDDVAYLAMELVPGEALSVLLRREGKLAPDRALDLIAQTARALDVAHGAGVVHRDVKPGNILVTPDGQVKVTDFGIARATASAAAAVTQTGMILGSAHYLSPEQATGKPATPASDVYALGVVLYECVSGRRPYDGETPVSIAAAHLYDEPPALPAETPQALDALVRQAMAKEPEDRFSSARAFAAAAESIRATLVGADTPTAVQDAEPADRTLVMRAADSLGGGDLDPDRRRGRLVMLVTAVALAAIAIVVAALFADDSATPATRPTPTRTSMSPAGPQPVTLPAGLIGAKYDNIRPVLVRLGLTPVTSYRNSDRPQDTVIDVEPDTGLRVGDTVQVTLSAGERDDDDKDDRGKGNGKGGKD